MKAFRLQYLTICPSLCMTNSSTMVRYIYSFRWHYIRYLVFLAQQNNIDDMECLPNDPEVCNYLKEFISEFTEEFLCHLA